MGRLAGSAPEDTSAQTSMLWLLESYATTAVPLAGHTGLTPRREPEPVTETESVRTMRAVAVLERPLEIEIVEPAAPPVLLAEQRLERRVDWLAVAAAAASDTAETAMGETVNISVSGVHLVMDRAPVVGPIELIVGDAVLGARVVDHRQLPDGRHAWHVHVLDNDDAWFELVGAASADAER